MFSIIAKKSAFLSLVLLVAACARLENQDPFKVRRDTVPNNPPTLDGKVEVFEREFGTLVPRSPSGISIFLWPRHLTDPLLPENMKRLSGAEIADAEAALAAKVEKVSRLSGEMNKIEAEITQRAQAEKLLSDEFEVLNCWDYAEEDDGLHVISWRKPDPAMPTSEQDEMSAAIEKCQEVQDRLIIAEKRNEEATDELRPQWARLGLAVAVEFDENPAKPENRIAIQETESRVSIALLPDGTRVSVFLKGFAGFDYATEAQGSQVRITEAHYNLKNRTLSFKLPELDAVGSPTGLVWSFMLKRGKYLHLDRFGGDVELLHDGHPIRFGTVTITGLLQ